MHELDKTRRWLGIYFLGTTAILGIYIILFKQTRMLPIPADDASSAFQIIIPTLVAQITVAYKWIASPPHQGAVQPSIPQWAVVTPPVLVNIILVATIVFLIIDGGNSDGGGIFKNVVTFCVSILSASTIFVVSAVFGGQGIPQDAAVAVGEQGIGQPDTLGKR